MKLKNILNYTGVSGQAFEESFSCSSIDVDKLNMLIVVTLANAATLAQAKAGLSTMMLDGLVRSVGKDDISFLRNVRVSDLLVMSDYLGGFSEAVNADSLKILIEIPAGSINQKGADAINFTLKGSSVTDVKYDVRIDAVDKRLRAEKMICYESILGNGADQFPNDVDMLFYMHGDDGSSIYVKDTEGIDQTVTARSMFMEYNLSGKAEKLVDAGVGYENRSGASSSLTLRLDSGKKGLLIKSHLDPVRVIEDKEELKKKERQVLENLDPNKRMALKSV